MSCWWSTHMHRQRILGQVVSHSLMAATARHQPRTNMIVLIIVIGAYRILRILSALQTSGSGSHFACGSIAETRNETTLSDSIQSHVVYRASQPITEREASCFTTSTRYASLFALELYVRRVSTTCSIRQFCGLIVMIRRIDAGPGSSISK